MTLDQFIDENDVFMASTCGDDNLLQAQQKLGISFGGGLMEYLRNYGYLGYEYVEFYGISQKAGMKSNLIRKTEYLHQYFPKTAPYIAFGDFGEGDYYLIDSEDNMYEFWTEEEKLIPLHCKIDTFILKSFEAVNIES